MWLELVARLERGEHPTNAELAEYVSHDRTIPKLAREYIAGRLTGKNKPPANRPPRTSMDERIADAMIQAEYVHLRETMTAEQARAELGEQYKLSPDTIRYRLRKQRKGK